jgi:glycosyltransferase involved in cell wall biosynthesis
MQIKKLITIIVNCYNGEKYLFHALESVKSQTYQNFELIFYDNCSTDNSKKIFDSFKDARFFYFKSKKKLPLGVARSNALKKSKGDFFLFFDCDDYLLPNKLEEQIKLFKNKFVGAVFSNSLSFSKFFKKKLYTNNKINDGKIFYDLIKNYNISLDTVIFKTKAVKKLKHSLDSKFNLIHDLDLIIRLSNLFLIKYYPKVLSHWRAHWSSTSNNAYLQFANEKKIFEKKILNLYPLDKKLKKNLFFFKEKVYVEECIGFLLNGNNSKARIVIKKISKIKYKFLIYLLLNIPFSNFLLRLLLYVNKVILLK